MENSGPFEVLKVAVGAAKSGRLVFEELPFRHTDGVYQLLRTPALLLGFAKGDWLRFDVDDGSPKLVSRSRNVAIHVYLSEPVEDLDEIEHQFLTPISGSIDGSNDKIMTICSPVDAGFSEIERCMKQLCAFVGGWSWHYGNVYDEIDGTTPLNWWLQ